jgi:copper chaperone
MQNLINHTYHVGGLHCGVCATTVQNLLAAVPGVTSVKVDLEKKQAEITSSALNETGTLQNALSTTHFTIEELRA